MDKIDTLEQLVDLVGYIRNLRKGFLTNFYLDIFKHTIWINKEILFFEKIGETLFLIKKNYSFWNVFYNTTTLDAFKNDLKYWSEKYPSVTMVFDVVGSGVTLEHQKNIIENLGFQLACTLVRMSRITPVNILYELDDQVKVADLDDINKVSDLLYFYFDEQLEQIPFLEELEMYAREKHILVHKENERVVAFVIFELNNSTLYLRYWFVLPEYREKKIGSKLFNRAFKEGRNTRRQMLWVIKSNENALKRHLHYGFKVDGVMNYTLIKEGKY